MPGATRVKGLDIPFMRKCPEAKIKGMLGLSSSHYRDMRVDGKLFRLEPYLRSAPERPYASLINQQVAFPQPLLVDLLGFMVPSVLYEH